MKQAATRIVTKAVLIPGHKTIAVYGYDPYNTADRHMLGMRIVRTFPGPLGPIAFRCQQSWDFCAGDVATKLRYYETHGMHGLPMRGMFARQAN